MCLMFRIIIRRQYTNQGDRKEDGSIGASRNKRKLMNISTCTVFDRVQVIHHAVTDQGTCVECGWGGDGDGGANGQLDKPRRGKIGLFKPSWINRGTRGLAL